MTYPLRGRHLCRFNDVTPSHRSAMSHIRNIDGNPQAAAEYQDYLARLGAHRRARSKSEDPVRAFDSEIDPDRGSAENHEGGSGEDDAEGDPSDGEPSGDAASEPGSSGTLIGRG